MKKISAVFIGGLFFLASLAFTGQGANKLPEAFAVLNLGNNNHLINGKIIQDKDFFENIAETQGNEKKFLVTAVDYHTLKMHKNVSYEAPFLENKFDVFSPPGEYLLRTFILRSYTDLPGISFKISNLQSKSGKQIDKANILILNIVETDDEYKIDDLLIAREIKQIEKNELLFFAVLINLPKDATPELYHSKIEVISGDSKQELSINCRVLDFLLPESEAAFGTFMPYYPHDVMPVNPRMVRALPCYNLANQENYFKFCKTRGFNSQSLFEFNLQYKDKDKLELNFEELDTQIAVLQKTGLDKAIVLDCRSFNGKALQLEKEEHFVQEGKNAIAIYAELAEQLVKHLKNKKDLRFFLLAEEEISNGGIKLRNYNMFGSTLQKIAGPEHSLMLDNEIGPGHHDAVDRGSVDGFKYRQYNNWTEEALAKAKAEGATIWSFNYGGFARTTYGFIQQRLGSMGFHQWADQWQRQWTYTIPSEKGVITSLKFESSHEGIVDYRYIQALKKIAPQSAKEMLAEIPVSRGASQAFFSSQSLKKMDLLRWRAALLLNPSFKAMPISGRPIFKTTTAKIASNIQSKDLSLTAALVTDDYPLEASEKRAAKKGNGTGPLRYMLARERRLRAYSADLEQTKKLLTPSYSGTFVNFNNKGLILFSQVNHTKYNEGSKRQDDDPTLWEDNCLEFFFRTPDGSKYQFIVNSSGNKVFLCDGIVINSAEIQCVLRPNKGAAEGYFQEALIPWSYFGRVEKPGDGEVWAFNAAREFHTWNQLTQWARSDGFWEDSQWGALKFAGKQNSEYFKEIELPDFCRPGKNLIAGKIPGEKPLNIILTDADGEILAEKRLSALERDFHFEFESSANSISSKKLSVMEGDRILEAINIPSRSYSSAFSADKTEVECWSGAIVSFMLTANFSQYGLTEKATDIALLDSTGKEVAAFPISFTKQKSQNCWLKTEGLNPGNYTLVANLKTPLGASFQNSCKLKLTVYPSPVQPQ